VGDPKQGGGPTENFRKRELSFLEKEIKKTCGNLEKTEIQG